MDFSQYDFPNDLWYAIPDWEMAIKIGTFIPIILLGIFGNVMMLNIIVSNRSLQTPTNLLLANMSAADLAMITICPILFMFNNFFQDFRLGVIGCKAEGFLEGAFLVTAVFNLCAVSYDRLTAIVLPTETRLTVRGAKIVMILSWVVGGISAVPLAIFRYYRERQWRNYLETYCSENPAVVPLYWHVLISVIVWFPLIVMLLCYSAILWKLDRYEQQVLKREHPISVSYKTKVAKTLFVVVLTFVLLRVPFTVLIFARNDLLKQSVINQVNGSFTVLWYSSHYLIFLNAAVNPLIYGLTNDNFRRAYHQTPLCGFFCGKQKVVVKPPSRPGGNASRLFRNLQPRSANACEQPNSPGRMRIWFNNSKANLRSADSPNSSKITLTTHIKAISKEGLNTDSGIPITDKDMKSVSGTYKANVNVFI